MKYVIIGGSAAGVSAAETLRKRDRRAEITLISDEEFPLYSRCLLTYLIAGSLDEQKLNFKDKDFYQTNNIKAHLGKKAVSVDAQKKTVNLNDGSVIAYDKLLLACGAYAKLVDIAGAEKQGVFTVRTIKDARAILRSLDQVKEIAVLGGGLIGLRDAYALRQRQKEVTVIVKSGQILSQMVDASAAKIIASKLEKNGIRIKTGLAAKEILGQETVQGIVLDNGEKLSCQMVIVGKGVNANTDLAESCGLKVQDGIVVDEYLCTSNQDIYAAGDCAQAYDVARGEARINALWPCAVEQGEVAALNMLGEKAVYEGSVSMNSVDFFGLPSISMGITKPKQEQDYEIISKENAGEEIYKKFVLKKNKIVGMVLVGDIGASGITSSLIKNQIDVSSVKHLLLEDNFDYAKIMPLISANKNKFKLEEYQDTMLTYHSSSKCLK